MSQFDGEIIWCDSFYISAPLLNENNSVEVNFNIHVLNTTSPDTSGTNSGPVLTVTSTTVDPAVTGNRVPGGNTSMSNAQQSAMSNMFKQFFK
jgi:hypothetical protein